MSEASSLEAEREGGREHSTGDGICTVTPSLTGEDLLGS